MVKYFASVFFMCFVSVGCASSSADRASELGVSEYVYKYFEKKLLQKSFFSFVNADLDKTCVGLSDDEIIDSIIKNHNLLVYSFLEERKEYNLDYYMISELDSIAVSSSGSYNYTCGNGDQDYKYVKDMAKYAYSISEEILKGHVFINE